MAVATLAPSCSLPLPLAYVVAGGGGTRHGRGFRGVVALPPAPPPPSRRKDAHPRSTKFERRRFARAAAPTCEAPSTPPPPHGRHCVATANSKANGVPLPHQPKCSGESDGARSPGASSSVWLLPVAFHLRRRASLRRGSMFRRSGGLGIGHLCDAAGVREECVGPYPQCFLQTISQSLAARWKRDRVLAFKRRDRLERSRSS